MKTTRNTASVGKEGKRPIHELWARVDASLRSFSVDPTPSRPLHLGLQKVSEDDLLVGGASGRKLLLMLF